MKKISLILITIALITVAKITTSYAATATANATVTYMAPITVTELATYSFTIGRKNGVAASTVVSTPVDSGSTAILTYLAQNPVASPGCVKITGPANTAIVIRITIPSTIGPFTLTSPAAVGIIDPVGCKTSGWPNATNLAGGTMTLPANGITYISWGVGTGGYDISVFGTPVTIANLNTATYTSTALIYVTYY